MLYIAELGRVSNGHGLERRHTARAYEPVERHEHQRVDARVHGHHDQVLDHLAPDVAERPVRQHVVDGGERHAQHDEQQVGQRQVDDQQIGGAAHLLVGRHHDHDQQISEQAYHHDDAEQYGHGQRHDLLHLRTYDQCKSNVGTCRRVRPGERADSVPSSSGGLKGNVFELKHTSINIKNDEQKKKCLQLM